MSNQEMQFADPDWKPSQQLNTNNNPQEQEVYTPQPINTDYRDQNKWRTAPPSPPQQEGYTGLRPYVSPVPGQMQGSNFRQRPYRRRGRGPWFWIILAFIIISLMSGGWRSFSVPNFDHYPFGNKSPIEKTYAYKVGAQPTLVVNDMNGNVTVTPGNSNADVIIKAVNANGFSGDPNVIQPTVSPDGNTINIYAQDSGRGSVDLNVVVPQNTILQLQTDSGDITVNGVDGQMTLNTNDGRIDASNDVLSGSSTMKTNSGDINFDGTIDTTGTYQFQTSNGNIDLTMPTTPSFHLDASTSSGSITNGFPGVNVQNNNSGSGQLVNAVVGGSSQGQSANVTIKSDNGDI